jgi:hypothetical protein
VIVRKNISKRELSAYLHGCCGSPVFSTWKTAIQNGNFITWPGLSSLSLDKNLPKSLAPAQGHLDQERKSRKNIQSTQVQVTPDSSTSDASELADFFPLPNSPNYSMCVSIKPFVPKRRAYHDLTGRLPHQSSQGNEYLLIVYDYDSNSILSCALKDKSAGEIKCR